MIKVIGIGLDGREGLPQKIQNLIDQATVLVGSDRHLSYFPDYQGKRLVINNLNETLTEIKNLFQQGENLVILASGDPLFFGIGRLLIEKLTSDILEFYPHLSSVQLAFNKLKISWQDAKLISVHGRSLEELKEIFPKGYEKIAILTDSVNNPQAIIKLYLSLDLPLQYDVWIGENLGSSEETFTKISPNNPNLHLSLSQVNFAPLNLVIFLRNQDEMKEIDLEKLPLFGLPDQIFLSFKDRPGLMTKREIRMIILGELGLQNQQIVWDIGAGTGSVSIEIARLCPHSQIYAIEKTAMGNNLIQKNSQRLGVSNVISLQGKAPDILTDLPSPDRIFIGGSGGNLLNILNVCQQKINQDGKIVLALATLEHLLLILDWLKENDYPYQIKQIQISRSIPLNNLTRFSPLNPVNLVTIDFTKNSN